MDGAGIAAQIVTGREDAAPNLIEDMLIRGNLALYLEAHPELHDRYGSGAPGVLLLVGLGIWTARLTEWPRLLRDAVSPPPPPEEGPTGPRIVPSDATIPGL